jgi:cobalt/nickel transport system permease protein
VAASSFVEGTLARILDSLESAERAGQYAERPGLLQRIDPRVKLPGFLLLICVIAGCRKLGVMAAILGGSLAFALLSRIPLNRIAAVWLGVLAFSGAIALPAIFLTPGEAVGALPILGWAITRQGLTSAAYLVLRGLTIATLSALLVLTTPWNHLLRAMRALHVPVVLVVLAGMTYRYIFLLLEKGLEMFQAHKARMVNALSAAERRRVVTSSIGVLVGKTHQLGSDVHLAMQARGYRGEVLLLGEQGLRRSDWMALALFAACGGLLWVLGR